MDRAAARPPIPRRPVAFARVGRLRSEHRLAFTLAISGAALLASAGLFFLNLRFGAGDYSFERIFSILGTPGWQDNSATEFAAVSKTLWTSCATIVGALGMGATALIVQSMTKNPLADASTLGISQGAVFGIVAILAFSGANPELVNYGYQFLMSVAGGAVAIFLLFLVVLATRGRISSYRIVLAGLALGIVFKTLAYLLQRNDDLARAINFSYVLGGAEEIYVANFADKWTVLIVSTALTAAGVAFASANARALTVMELGEERSHGLGISVRRARVMSALALLTAAPGAVIVVGNVAFLGLFAAHIARYLVGTRDYRHATAPTLLVAVAIASLGLQLTERVPSINSGLWTTFVGVPYLIYIGVRGLK